MRLAQLEEESMDENYMRALLVERAGLARRGLADRVAQVDAELKRIGAEVPREAKPEPLRTAARKPRVTRG